MKHRAAYIIIGTANNGQQHYSLRIFATSQALAEAYAAQHFKEAKIRCLG